MLLLGLGILKNEALVKSMSRHGDYRYEIQEPSFPIFFGAEKISLISKLTYDENDLAF